MHLERIEDANQWAKKVNGITCRKLTKWEKTFKTVIRRPNWEK